MPSGIDVDFLLRSLPRRFFVNFMLGAPSMGLFRTMPLGRAGSLPA